MKKAFIIIVLKTLILFADVAYNNYHEDYFHGNIEGILNFESIIPKPNLGLSIWTGYAYVYPFRGEHASFGSETAVEVRKYFLRRVKLNNLFIGIYNGFAFMRIPTYYSEEHTGNERTFGISYGLKSGYKFMPLQYQGENINIGAAIEPYVSISHSVYKYYNYWEVLEAPLYTIGLRIVFELFKYYKGNEINVEEVPFEG